MNKRTVALAIGQRTKIAVWKRDGHRCVVCGDLNASPNAHFIPRSQSGLGIEKNIVTLCADCHRIFDQGTAEEREEIRQYLRGYLKEIYPDWNENDLIYRKEY